MAKIGDKFGAEPVWGEKDQTVNLLLDPDQSSHPGVQAAIDFSEKKNALRWRNTKERLGKSEAALLSARIALHRQLDTRAIFIQFGQGGWIFDNVLSRFTDERQQALKT